MRSAILLCLAASLGTLLSTACSGTKSCVEHLTTGTSAMVWCYEESTCPGGGAGTPSDTFNLSSATCQDQGFTQECTDTGAPYYVSPDQGCIQG
jgi:hypothetical protein